MRLGWIAHSSLRRDQLAPIGSTDKYYGTLEALRGITGEPVHWFQLKKLTPDCHEPGPNAQADEVSALDSVIHYGDYFNVMKEHFRGAPSQGRFEYFRDHPMDWANFPVDLPELDVCIVEGTHQIGAAYLLTFTLHRLWQLNPNIGFIFFDQDLGGQACRGKAGKWHPDIVRRSVVLTYHPDHLFENQGMAIIPHQEQMERSPVTEGDTVCYVGNDYLRRESMLRLLRNDWTHHYGRLKPEFEPELRATGCTLHGPWEPSRELPTVEDVYRQHGFAVALLRDDYYKRNLLTPRISESTRAGCVTFMDRKMPISIPILGDWFHVESNDELRAKICWLLERPRDDHSREGYAMHQLNMVRHYTSVNRYVEAIWCAAQHLVRGPLMGYRYNPYNDLLAAAGLTEWQTVTGL